MATWVGAEHPLFILYTSGSTGKPKGVQHSSGGYLLWAMLRRGTPREAWGSTGNCESTQRDRHATHAVAKKVQEAEDA